MLINRPLDESLLIESDLISGKAVFNRVSWLALPMAASFTFSIGVAALVLFLSRLNQDEEHEASITLITTMINALVVIGISPLLALSMVASKQKGKMTVAEIENNNEADQQERKENIARINHHGVMMRGPLE